MVEKNGFIHLSKTASTCIGEALGRWKNSLGKMIDVLSSKRTQLGEIWIIVPSVICMVIQDPGYLRKADGGGFKASCWWSTWIGFWKELWSKHNCMV